MSFMSYWLDVSTIVISADGEDLQVGPMRFSPAKNPDGIPPRIIESSDGSGKALQLAVMAGAYSGSLDDPKDGDENDRCELREPDKIAMGSDVWHGFSMRIPPEFPDVGERCIVAQVKMPYADDGSSSPAFALRIDSGRLYATVEHIFQPEDAHLLTPPDGGVCALPAARAFPHEKFTSNPADTVVQVRALLASETSALPPHMQAQFAQCTSAVKLESFASIPAADGRWIDFIVHVDSSDSMSHDGIVELFVDGVLIARARGEFGYCGCVEKRQYFKIGPYRNSSAAWGTEAAAVEIRDVRRGPDHLSVKLGGPADPRRKTAAA